VYLYAVLPLMGVMMLLRVFMAMVAEIRDHHAAASR
jgi:TRAP-type C4-dicarboxylate transport system permease small subunit